MTSLMLIGRGVVAEVIPLWVDLSDFGALRRPPPDAQQ